MAEANKDNDAKADQYSSQHGKIVRVELNEVLFCFRRPNLAEITVFNKNAMAQRDMSVQHSIGLCRSCYLGPTEKADLEKAFNDFPLAFAGTQSFDGVADRLIELSTGEAKITVK